MTEPSRSLEDHPLDRFSVYQRWISKLGHHHNPTADEGIRIEESAFETLESGSETLLANDPRLADELFRMGLVTEGATNGLVRWNHRTIQEFLTARYWARRLEGGNSKVWCRR